MKQMKIVENGVCGKNINYELAEDGVLSVSYVVGAEEWEWMEETPFGERSDILEVIITDGVLDIADYAFKYCPELRSVVMPEGLKRIGVGAFIGCAKLEHVELPQSVTYVGGRAFDGSIWMNNMPDGEIYMNSCFYSYKGVMPKRTNVTINEGTTHVASTAFVSAYDALVEVLIPNTVVEIGEFAFIGCSGLRSITIPKEVTLIEGYALVGCVALEEIVCLAIEPPRAYYLCEVYDNCVLKVPYGSKQAYAEHEEWGKFRYIEELDVE